VHMGLVDLATVAQVEERAVRLEGAVGRVNVGRPIDGDRHLGAALEIAFEVTCVKGNDRSNRIDVVARLNHDRRQGNSPGSGRTWPHAGLRKDALLELDTLDAAD